MFSSTYSQMPVIETKNYTLREVTLDDASDMFEYYKQLEVVKYLPINVHKSISDTRYFIKTFFIDNYKKGKIGHFAVVDRINNKVIGNVGLNNIDKNDTQGEFGICINPTHWGHDIATELGREVLKFIFNNTNVKIIVANTYEDNKRTRKSLNNLNFRYYKTYDKKIVRGIKITYIKCDSYKIDTNHIILLTVKIKRIVIFYF